MEVEIDLRDAPLRVAVLGLGAIGRQHTRILSELPGVDLIAVCDVNANANEELTSRLQVPVVQDFHDVISMRPDAVINALPTHLHYETSVELLKAGIHLLVEKPISSEPAEASEMIKFAKDADVTLMVGHVERFNAGVLALKEVIEQGRLGDIISVVTRRVGVARPAVPHANVALDLAIHDVDVLRFILGQNGELVSSHGRSIQGNQLEDHADLVLRYGDTFCTIQANWITPVKIRRLSLTGTKGTAELDYISQQLSIYEAVPEVIKGQPWDFFAVSRESEPINIDVVKSEPLRNELSHFLQCVRTGQAPIVPADQARDALALVVQASEQFAEV